MMQPSAGQAMSDRDSSRREPLLWLRGTCLGGLFRLTRGERPAGPA
jgi:hypothetical protein